MIKECKTIGEFNELLNEYLKYHHSRWSVGESEIGDKYLIGGLYYHITKPEQFKDEEIRAIFGSNVCILDESLPLLGRYCSCEGKEGEFIGIEATEEDFYYMLRDSKGGVHYYTCCGGIKDKFPGIDYNGSEEEES